MIATIINALPSLIVSIGVMIATLIIVKKMTIKSLSVGKDGLAVNAENREEKTNGKHSHCPNVLEIGKLFIEQDNTWEQIRRNDEIIKDIDKELLITEQMEAVEAFLKIIANRARSMYIEKLKEWNTKLLGNSDQMDAIIMTMYRIFYNYMEDNIKWHLKQKIKYCNRNETILKIGDVIDYVCELMTEMLIERNLEEKAGLSKLVFDILIDAKTEIQKMIDSVEQSRKKFAEEKKKRLDENQQLIVQLKKREQEVLCI
jgi:hypothetical protein